MADASDTPNIGFVLYTKSYAPGTLNARWMFSGKYSGPGIATGGPKEGFAGRYHVRYFYDSGEFSDEYDLVIEKTAESYKVSWIVDGNVLALGIGMEVEDGLAVVGAESPTDFRGDRLRLPHHAGRECLHASQRQP